MTNPTTPTQYTCDAACHIRRRWALCLAAGGCAGLAGYLAIAGLFGLDWAGIRIGAAAVVGVALLSFFIALFGLDRAAQRGRISLDGLVNLAVLLPVSLIGLLALDFSYAAYIERSAPPPPLDDRHFDSHFAAGEFYPPLYYPTPRNFRLHRPGISVTVSHYGDYFSTQLLQSKTLREQVLSLKQVTVASDQHGLRESRSFDGAKIAALGDSFTFGWGIAEPRTWVRQLERRRGERVVNLGIHDGSPKQQLAMLKYVLSQQGAHLPLKRLIWLLYEGNDLEDSYADMAPEPLRKPYQRGLGPLLHNLFVNIKDNMLIEQFRQQRVELAGDAMQQVNKHLNIDGVPLEVPLYQSARLGPALFLSTYIERGLQPERYVMQHENRASLDKTFADMAQFAQERGFQVSVAIAPTAARLHGRYFEDFPALAAPHFINYVAQLAKQHGLTFINLLDLFAAQADKQFLYFRDDDHWNEAGHSLAAEMIARYAFAN